MLPRVLAVLREDAKNGVIKHTKLICPVYNIKRIRLFVKKLFAKFHNRNIHEKYFVHLWHPDYFLK